MVARAIAAKRRDAACHRDAESEDGPTGFAKKSGQGLALSETTGAGSA